MERKKAMKKSYPQKHLFRYLPIAALLFLLVVWTLWGNTALMVNTITVSGNQIPLEFSGFRIAQISDLHNAEFGEKNSRLLNILSEKKPDIIVGRRN